MNNMPLSIQLDDLRNNIISILNDAHLPSYIIELVIKDIYRDVSEASKEQLQKDKNEYQQLQKETTTNEEE